MLVIRNILEEDRFKAPSTIPLLFYCFYEIPFIVTFSRYVNWICLNFLTNSSSGVLYVQAKLVFFC
jgi:hypothetical protein